MRLEHIVASDYDVEYEQLVEQEALIFQAMELITEALQNDGLSKADLADRLGKSRAFVSQVLDGSRNMTLRTLSDLAFALGYRVHVHREAIPEIRRASAVSHSDVKGRVRRPQTTMYRRFLDQGHEEHLQLDRAAEERVDYLERERTRDNADLVCA